MAELNTPSIELEAQALIYAKANKKKIARKRTNIKDFPPEVFPVSVFMAGSPGAGKTEASIALVKKLQGDVNVLRIDPDELRNEFSAYNGGNSYLFQKGVSILVEKIHDLALKQGQSFLLDGTLSNFDKSKLNIQRSLDKKRLVKILYVYQEPRLAWAFVQAREAVEGRRILPDHFIDQYFSARRTVNRLKEEFGKQVEIDLLIKNIDNSPRLYRDNVDNIDNHIPEKYTATALIKVISSVVG